MDPQKWTPLWTRSMDFPCGSPLIFEDEFYQRSKWILGTFKIMDETAVSLYYQAYGLHILYCTRSNFLEFRTWIRFIWWKNNNISVVGWKKSPTQTFFFFVPLSCIPSPDFPSLDGPSKCFFIWQTYSLLPTNQAQNDLHITVMSRSLSNVCPTTTFENIQVILCLFRKED